MYWVALRFPHLALESLLRGHAPSEPDGACHAIARAGAILDCDARARALGAQPGMALAAAWELVPGLQVHARNWEGERRALEGIAVWLCRFTPAVSLEPPSGILADMQGSLRLFGGAQMLAAAVRTGLAEIGFTAQLAAAPTARAAWWLVCAGQERLIEDCAVLEAELDALPAAIACDHDDARVLLHGIGVRSIRELLALPRPGVARRFGPAMLEALDRALGRIPEPRRFFTPPARFVARLELPAEVIHAEGVLFAARRLLLELEGLLLARQSGARSFTLLLMHRGAPPTRIESGLAFPGWQAERFVQVLRQRLAGHALRGPVEAIGLEADGFEALAGANAELFGGRRAAIEVWLQIVERLQARLGAEAIHGLEARPDHRPERAWGVLAQGDVPAVVRDLPQPRPLWLLDPPRRLPERGGVPHDGRPLELLTGPERIESGWWDGMDVGRDYFIARLGEATLLWVFRTRDGWYLHGIFS